MNENTDLDIYNYNYLDLLQLFKIKDDFNNLNKIIMNEKIKIIKEKLTPEYYYFYLKAYKIIICHCCSEVFWACLIDNER